MKHLQLFSIVNTVFNHFGKKLRAEMTFTSCEEGKYPNLADLGLSLPEYNERQELFVTKIDVPSLLVFEITYVVKKRHEYAMGLDAHTGDQIETMYHKIVHSDTHNILAVRAPTEAEVRERMCFCPSPDDDEFDEIEIRTWKDAKIWALS